MTGKVKNLLATATRNLRQTAIFNPDYVVL